MTQQKTSRAGIFSWMLFDWAAQPYHTLLITFVFAPYFVANVAADPTLGQQQWGLATGLAGLFIALLAPVLGSLADLSGPRKPWIAAFSVLAIAGAWMLWPAMPGGGAPVTFVLFGFAIALIGIEFAAIFSNAMMPTLVPRAELGKLSGSGWALGYAGGLVSLVICLGFMSASPETGKTLLGVTPLFGLDPQTHAGDRASGPFSALWYLIFVIPLFVLTPDAPRKPAQKGAVTASLKSLWHTVRALPKRPSYLTYLIASMFYRDGLNALYAFGGIYAAGVLGLSIIEIGIFGILAALAGAIGAFGGGRLDARFGPRFVCFWTCWLLVAACVIIISTTPDTILFALQPPTENAPLMVFYVAGCLIGAAGGALQAASRTLLVDQVTPDEVTQAFGLYALTGRATAFMGPLLIALVTALSTSQRIGVTPIILLLALGAIGLIWVREKLA